MWAITLAAVAAYTSAAAASPPPHLVYILADDFGYFDVSFKGNPSASTPNLDALANEGLLLNRYYSYKFCSPTRSSLMSGRYPLHVNTENNPASKPGGVDLRMTLISEKLKALGYFTGVAGKWHAGGHVSGQLPINRGFDRSLLFLNGNEDHYTHWFGIDSGFDMWQDDANLYDNTTYGGFLYTRHALQTIAEFDPKKHRALFLYVPFQNTHAPFEVPKQYVNTSVARQENKQTYLGMGSCMDQGIGNITAALKARGLWDNTLVVFSADNGGEVSTGGNNWPLRGGKYTDFEGGNRNVAFAAGGWLAPELRGAETDELLHVADIWATFSSLAGDTNATLDAKTEAWNAAAAAGDMVPPPDSFDASAVFRSKGGRSGRSEVALSSTALIIGDHKIVQDANAGGKNIWMTPDYPAFDANNSKSPVEIGPACKPYCIFNLSADPQERHDLSDAPEGRAVAPALLARLTAIVKTSWETGDHAYLGKYTNCTSLAAYKSAHRGFLGPLCYECLTPPCTPTPPPTPPPTPTPPTPAPKPGMQLRLLSAKDNQTACLVPDKSAKRAPLALGACGSKAAFWQLSNWVNHTAHLTWADGTWENGFCLRPDDAAIESGKCAAGVDVYIGQCSSKCPGVRLAKAGTASDDPGFLQSTGCPGFCVVLDAHSGSTELGSCASQGAMRNWVAEQPSFHE